MSDTFDHEGDAWDSYDRRFDDGDHFFKRRRSTNPRFAAITAAHLKDNSEMVDHELISQTHETEKAYLLVFVFGGENIERWLPKSQVTIPFADVLRIPRWLVDRIKLEIASGQTHKRKDGDGSDHPGSD